MRAVLYARVSTDDQRSNYSIPTQIAEAVRYADRRGFSIVGDQYIDSSSGHDCEPGNGTVRAYVDDYTSLELSRPSLDAAIRFLDAYGFDVFVVHSLDRLARDPYIRRTLELEIESRGAVVEYVQGGYDNTPTGEVRKDLDATFAKWENAKRVERSLRGKKGKATKGLFVGGRPPFGYYIDQDVTGGLAVDEAQAGVVKRIFDMYVNQDLSIREIARKLTEAGARNHSGSTQWGKTSVTRILQNTTYVGRNYYNKWKRMRGGRELKARAPEKWIEIETTPIVDEPLFQAAQQKLKANKKQRRRKATRFYLLSGMVLCDDCEHAYYTETAPAGKERRASDTPVYRHRISHGHCRNRQISGRRMEPVVWKEIRQLFMDPDALRQGYNDSLAQQQATAARQRTRLQELHKQQNKLELRRQNLTAAYIDPDLAMTKEEYLAQRQLIDNEEKDTARDIGDIAQELASIPTPADLETLEAFSAEMRATLEEDVDFTPEEKRRLFQLLHLTVYVGAGDELRIEGWFETRSTVLLDTTR